MSITDLEIKTVDENDIFDPFEIRAADLARLVGVTPTTIANWARNHIIPTYGEYTLGGGRPQRTFDLRYVFDALADAEGGTYGVYLPALDKEITRRSKAQAKATEANIEAALEDLAEDGLVKEVEISQTDVLINRIDHLEHLVVSLAAKLKDGEPISADESLEVLDIVFRHYDVQGY